MKTLDLNPDEMKSAWAKLQRDGYRSAHYWIQHSSFRADELRSMGLAGKIRAKTITSERGQSVWYYHEDDIGALGDSRE